MEKMHMSIEDINTLTNLYDEAMYQVREYKLPHRISSKGSWYAYAAQKQDYDYEDLDVVIAWYYTMSASVMNPTRETHMIHKYFLIDKHWKASPEPICSSMILNNGVYEYKIYSHGDTPELAYKAYIRRKKALTMRVLTK